MYLLLLLKKTKALFGPPNLYVYITELLCCIPGTNNDTILSTIVDIVNQLYFN